MDGHTVELTTIEYGCVAVTKRQNDDFGLAVEFALEGHIGQFGGTFYELLAEIVPARPDAPPDNRSLAQHCRDALPGYKVPREFRCVDHLARTATGKVARS